MREVVLQQKESLVAEIKEHFETAASAVVVEYRGLNVEAITQLRRELTQNDVDFKVYKNTMTRRALAGSEFEALNEVLSGPNAIAFSKDAVAPSRVLANFAKKNKSLVIKQGIVEGKIVGLDTIKELSSLPNREGMLSMLLGALKSPLRDLAWAVKQIAEQKEAGSETDQAAKTPVEPTAEAQTLENTNEETKAEVETAATEQE